MIEETTMLGSGEVAEDMEVDNSGHWEGAYHNPVSILYALTQSNLLMEKHN